MDRANHGTVNRSMECWCMNGQPDSVPTELVLSDQDSVAAFLKSGIGKSCKKAVRIGNKLYFAEFFSSDFMDRGDERQGLSLGLYTEIPTAKIISHKKPPIPG